MSNRAAAAALILGLGLSGCAGAAQARDIIIYEPPPPRVEGHWN
ncbi:MAG: hypothetical protein OJI70_04570 [Zavarzinia sp.]|nr:hypothetical protein [Zavarzinia sp.]